MSHRLTISLSLALLLLLALASLAVGDMPLTLSQIIDGLLHRDELAATILWQMRIPRLLIAILCGAALSSSGLIMQAYFRNSLASPGLLGVSSGAAAGAVVAISAGIATSSILVAPAAAIIGAGISTAVVVMLARNGASTERLLLSGVALNALLGAITSYVLSNVSLTYDRNAQILFWLLGGLEDRTWDHVLMASPIVIASILLWPLGRPMDLLALGPEAAQSLGVNVRKLRRELILLSTILTALATATTGTVGFVGLVVPHILRLLVGPEHKKLLPLSLTAGPAFILVCDLIGRSAGNLRIGIVTSLLGGPFFLYLLRKRS